MLQYQEESPIFYPETHITFTSSMAERLRNKKTRSAPGKETISSCPKTVPYIRNTVSLCYSVDRMKCKASSDFGKMTKRDLKKKRSFAKNMRDSGGIGGGEQQCDDLFGGYKKGAESLPVGQGETHRSERGVGGGCPQVVKRGIRNGRKGECNGAGEGSRKVFNEISDWYHSLSKQKRYLRKNPPKTCRFNVDRLGGECKVAPVLGGTRLRDVIGRRKNDISWSGNVGRRKGRDFSSWVVANRNVSDSVVRQWVRGERGLSDNDVREDRGEGSISDSDVREDRGEGSISDSDVREDRGEGSMSDNDVTELDLGEEGAFDSRIDGSDRFINRERFYGKIGGSEREMSMSAFGEGRSNVAEYRKRGIASRSGGKRRSEQRVKHGVVGASLPNRETVEERKGDNGDSETESWGELVDHGRVETTDRITRANVTRDQDTTRDICDNTQCEKEDTLNVGRIVWGKFGSHTWWPGMIVSGNMFHMEPAKFCHIWLFWFGDNKVSEIQSSKMIPFVSNYLEMFRKIRPKSKQWMTGVIDAIRECAARMGSGMSRTDSELLDWAAVDFPGYNLSMCPPNTENLRIPLWVRGHLRDIGEKIASSRRKSEREDIGKIADTPIDRAASLSSIRAANLDLKDICLSCLDPDDPIVSPHPFFVGGLCQKCKDQLMATMFAVGDDGSGVFCTVCANGGDMFVCSSLSCLRVFCRGCINDFAGHRATDRVAAADPWMCFLCEPDQQAGLLRVKSDWQANIVALFGAPSHTIEPLDHSKLRNAPLRILSLFDGIGTGRYVVDSLGLQVDAYFGCEVDKDAMLVTSVNLPDKVTQLGDVTKLDKAKILDICPIDLVIGGSPCNDISCVNPARKGLLDYEGTGVLFFEFYRILNIVKECSPNNHVLWLFENVAFMPHAARATISRFLQCEPALWDAKYFSAQNRPRLFWGNIPGVYSTPDIYLTQNCHKLEDVLIPNCNRHAKVDKIRTVTTRSNSLKQGKHDDAFPVSMDGGGDVVWIQELEKIFGFPEHFTDVSNLTPGRRQKLLGKAWSVSVVKHILSPLTHFFPTIHHSDHDRRAD